METAAPNLVEPVVTVTASAVEQLKAIHASQPGHAGKSLRVYVEGGGCSGTQYGMVFDEKRDGDATTELDGVSVVVDGASANHLRGAVIDFSENLNRSGFVIRNPNARKSCGCGKSFEA